MQWFKATLLMSDSLDLNSSRTTDLGLMTWLSSLCLNFLFSEMEMSIVLKVSECWAVVIKCFQGKINPFYTSPTPKFLM